MGLTNDVEMLNIVTCTEVTGYRFTPLFIDIAWKY